VCVSEEKVKDYKYYLRMWAKEEEPAKESIKDLPRMSQVSPTLCIHVTTDVPLFYSLFSATAPLT